MHIPLVILSSQKPSPHAKGHPHSHTRILTPYVRLTFTANLESDRLGSQSQFYHLLAVRSWTNYLTYISLCFLLYKTELMSNMNKTIYAQYFSMGPDI